MRPTPDIPSRPPAVVRRVLQRGFTLIEAILVIVITGIVAGIVAVFMSDAIRSYFDTTRRAQLTDTADTALRRVARDIQAALPNSVRVNGAFLEFVPIVDAGRYRTEIGTNPADNPLKIAAADDGFDILGPPVTVARNDWVVIFNMGQPGASVYDATPANAYKTSSEGTVSNLTFAAPVQFAFPSPGNRFQIVRHAVTYHCDVAHNRLMRYSNYAIQSAQPADALAAPLLNASAAVMAQQVSACSLNYASGVLERNGLVTLRLTLTEHNESVDLMYQVNVANTP